MHHACFAKHAGHLPRSHVGQCRATQLPWYHLRGGIVDTHALVRLNNDSLLAVVQPPEVIRRFFAVDTMYVCTKMNKDDPISRLPTRAGRRAGIGGSVMVRPTRKINNSACVTFTLWDTKTSDVMFQTHTQ